jgi:hypothetical protein
MIIRNISIRSKLIMTSLILVVLLSLLALIYVDASRRLSDQSVLLKERNELDRRFLALQNDFYALSAEAIPAELAALLQQIHGMEEQLGVVVTHEIPAHNQAVSAEADQMRSLLDQLEESLRLYAGTDQAPRIRARTDMEILGACMEELNMALSGAGEQARKRGNRHLGLSLALAIFILTNSLLIFAVNLSKAFRNVSEQTLKLSRGAIPPPLDDKQDNEFGKIAAHLNVHTGELQKKIQLISSMSKEGPGELFTPDAEDEL